MSEVATGVAAFLTRLLMEGGSGRKVDPFAELLLFGLGAGLSIVALVLTWVDGPIQRQLHRRKTCVKPAVAVVS